MSVKSRKYKSSDNLALLGPSLMFHAFCARFATHANSDRATHEIRFASGSVCNGPVGNVISFAYAIFFCAGYTGTSDGHADRGIHSRIRVRRMYGTLIRSRPARPLEEGSSARLGASGSLRPVGG